MEKSHFGIEDDFFGVDHEASYVHKTSLEVEGTYLQKVKRFLPMWEAWLVKNLDLLFKFEQWEPVADRKDCCCRLWFTESNTGKGRSCSKQRS